MIVYRVENVAGQGPYVYTEVNFSFSRMHTAPDHPPPWQEGLEMHNCHFCAFQSMEHLTAWFNEEERAIMRQRGFRVVRYEAPDVQVGQKQVVFARHTAKYIGEEQLPA